MKAFLGETVKDTDLDEEDGGLAWLPLGPGWGSACWEDGAALLSSPALLLPPPPALLGTALPEAAAAISLTLLAADIAPNDRSWKEEKFVFD